MWLIAGGGERLWRAHEQTAQGWTRGGRRRRRHGGFAAARKLPTAAQIRAMGTGPLYGGHTPGAPRAGRGRRRRRHGGFAAARKLPTAAQIRAMGTGPLYGVHQPGAHRGRRVRWLHGGQDPWRPYRGPRRCRGYGHQQGELLHLLAYGGGNHKQRRGDQERRAAVAARP